jgi:hypothetical protein
MGWPWKAAPFFRDQRLTLPRGAALPADVTKHPNPLHPARRSQSGRVARVPKALGRIPRDDSVRAVWDGLIGGQLDHGAAKRGELDGHDREPGPCCRFPGLRLALATGRSYPAAMTTTGRRIAAGGPPPPPSPARNTASLSGQSLPSGLALQRATMASSQAAPKAPKSGT